MSSASSAPSRRTATYQTVCSYSAIASQTVVAGCPLGSTRTRRVSATWLKISTGSPAAGGVSYQDEGEYAQMCEDRKNAGYNSGMGEIFRKVAGISSPVQTKCLVDADPDSPGQCSMAGYLA